jgi:class 3 adenylate cyclase
MDQIDRVVFAPFGSPAGAPRPGIARVGRQPAGRAGGRYARRLVAIMYADVASYSRLTGTDEDGTHARLTEYLDAMSAAIERHGGEVTHYAGDAVLAQFASVTDAASCALAIQRTLRARNADLALVRRVEFRIGINVGDVIADRRDIYGNAVNVAARLQSLAEPGGICVSEAVREATASTLAAEYRFIGRRRVKNIARPLRAYRLCDPECRKAHARGFTALLRLVYGALRMRAAATMRAGLTRTATKLEPVAEGADF